jgi:hypothetical protein
MRFASTWTAHEEAARCPLHDNCVKGSPGPLIDEQVHSGIPEEGVYYFNADLLLVWSATDPSGICGSNVEELGDGAGRWSTTPSRRHRLSSRESATRRCRAAPGTAT